MGLGFVKKRETVLNWRRKMEQESIAAGMLLENRKYVNESVRRLGGLPDSWRVRLYLR